MKRLMFAGFAVLIAIVALPAAAEATLEDILARHVASKGGMDAIDAIESLRIEGRVTLGPGQEATMVTELKRPNSMRSQVEVQGMTIVQAFDGETAWRIVPFSGSDAPQEITGPEVEGLRDQADLDGPLINCEARGETLEFVGTEELDGAAVHKVKLTKKNGDATTFFLDAERSLIVKSLSKQVVQGMAIDIEATYGDYREVAGVMMWHSLEAAGQGTPISQTITYEKIEANVELPAERFAMPVAKAAEPVEENGE